MSTPTRVTAYLAASRGDGPITRGRTRTGKRRKGVKCNPPNKKCGDRCIPANWNCRITGGGLDSHSRVVEYDPVRGAAGVIRGVKTTAKGIKEGDIELINRGTKGIERGIVKLTPGNSIEAKQRFRKRLRRATILAGTAIVLGTFSYKTHQRLKSSFPQYRDGLGRDIDTAARDGIQRTLDIYDNAVRGVGLGGMATQRASIQAGGAAAARRLGIAQQVARRAGAQPGTNPRTSRYLRSRALKVDPYATGFSPMINEIVSKARTENWSVDRFESELAYGLYSHKAGTHSAFSKPAAHEFLAAQWGFVNKLPHGRTIGTGTNRVPAVAEAITKRELGKALQEQSDLLKADFRRRGLQMTRNDINTYAEALIRENPRVLGLASSASERNELRTKFNDNIRTFLQADSKSVREMANAHYKSAVDMYDNYFAEAASTLRYSSSANRPVVPKQSNESHFFDAQVGVARILMLRGPRNSVMHAPRSAEAANFLTSHFYHTHVLHADAKTRPPYMVRSGNTLRRYAESLSNQKFSTSQAAIEWFNANGYNVAVGTPRKPRRPAPPSA